MDIPKKFQNNDGSLNSEILLKSYSELEKKMGSMIAIPSESDDESAREKFNRAIGVPESESEYVSHPLFDDQDVRKRFLDAGLSKSQAEKVFEIANDLLTPVLSDVFSSKYESDEITELKNFFGTDDKMQTALSEIEKFGEKFLPSDVFENLSSSSTGIKSIYRMMQSMDPEININSNTLESLTDVSLRKMMQDPKYWRDRDPEYIRKIETGFKKLYQ